MELGPAYPGQSTTYQAAVQQPINADGTSKFKANGNAVIPVKFALTQAATGPFVFESIGNRQSPTHTTTRDLSFTPNTPVMFNRHHETVSQRIRSHTGNCHGGALRWSVRTSPTVSALVIYYGDHPNFTELHHEQSKRYESDRYVRPALRHSRRTEGPSTVATPHALSSGGDHLPIIRSIARARRRLGG